MSLDRKALRFVEELAEIFLKEKHGMVISAKDQKGHFKRTISSLVQGKLQRELCKYSPLYCKRFQRCVRNLKQKLEAPQGINASHLHNGSTAEICQEDTRAGPAGQRSSEIEGEKQGEAARVSPSVPVRSKEKPHCSKETKDLTCDRDDGSSRASPFEKQSVPSHPSEPGHSIMKPDLTEMKDNNIGHSKNVNDLSRELTTLYHHCDYASLTTKMNHAVGLFSVEVADIYMSKNINRASDVLSCLHSVMLYFHFKSDILHTYKNQVPISKDSAYKQYMATMLSLYYSLNILITRSDSERSRRMAQHTLFKACLLLDGNELLMDVILQLSVKPEPVDAPYLHPTLMHMLEHPPYPFTPISYIKYVLVCRLARYILPQNNYPELTKQLQSSLSLLPPDDLNTWLTDQCPHLTSEMSSYLNSHQMTSYLLQIASYDLCNELQRSLYSQPVSVSLGAGVEAPERMDDVAVGTHFSGAVNTDGDPQVIDEHCDIDVEELLESHSKESNISGIFQDDSTESGKPAEDSVKEICKDVNDNNVPTKTPTTSNTEGQKDTTSDASVIRKVERKPKLKANTVKTLPLEGKVGVDGEGASVTMQENESKEKVLRGATSDAPVVGKKAGRKSEKKRKVVETLPLAGTVGEDGEEVLVIAPENEANEKQLEGTTSHVIGTEAERKSKKKASTLKTPQAGKVGEVEERVLVIAQGNESNETAQAGKVEEVEERVLVIAQGNESNKTTLKGITSDASVVSEKAERKSEKEASALTILPQEGKIEGVEEEVLVIPQENKSDGKQLTCTDTASSSDERLLKQCKQDLMRVEISPMPSNLNFNKEKHVANCTTPVTTTNHDCLESNNLVEDCVVPDSCDEETGSVDIIYDSETEYSDHLQQRIALRKARNLRSLLPSADSSKATIGSESSRIMTRSKKSLSNAGSVQGPRENKQGKSPRKKMEEFQPVSPVFKDCMPFEMIRVRLVHIDRNRGSLGRAKEVETEKGNSSPALKQASQIRRSPIRFDAMDMWDSKNGPKGEQATDEAPESRVSGNAAGSSLNASTKIDSNLKRMTREWSHRKKSDISSSPKKLNVPSKKMSEKKLLEEHSIDSQTSVICLDSADDDLSASTREASMPRRSPRKFCPLNKSGNVVIDKLSVDTHKAVISHAAEGIQRTGTKEITSLRRSPRKLEFTEKEVVTDQSLDPYEFSMSSDSAVVCSRASTGVASSLRRSSLKGNLQDKSQSPTGRSFPQSSSSYRERLRQPVTSVATGHHSLKKNVDKVVTSRQQKLVPARNEKGQFVPTKKDASYVGLKAKTAFSAKCPLSPKSSLSQFRSHRKRSFSDGCDDQSSSSAKVFASRRGSSEEHPVLRSRVSLKKIGIVPPYTRVCDSKLSQGGSPSGVRTSLGASSSSSRTADRKDSPIRSRAETSPSRSSARRTANDQDSPRSSERNSWPGLRLSSSPRKRLFRKALEFT